MDLNRIPRVIEKAICGSVAQIRLPGIVDAAIGPVAVSPEQVQQVAAQIEQRGYCEFGISAEVELFLHVSNTDLLSSIESTEFHIRVNVEENDFRAIASTSKDWAIAWERGIEPIKQAALRSMHRDVRNIAGDIVEDSYTFQAAIVLLASELVGPYVDRIATFAGYPHSLIQVMAVRLYEAKIWERDEVRCENWFDRQMGVVAFGVDLMVTEGKLIRSWSEETKEYEYSEPGTRAVSRLVV